MAILDIRQRSGYLFLAVMLGHVILISAQVNSRSGVPVLESVTFGVFAEVQRGSSSGVSGAPDVWNRYVWLRGVEAENASLKRKLDEVQMQFQERRALADRARGLQELLELRDRSNLQTMAAEIIASSASPDFRTLTIDKGTQYGLQPDMAVIAPGGVVGRVVIPSRAAAKVQLLIDRNAAAGALIERSRAQGVAMGGGDPHLRLEFVSEAADVVVGDLVVTSGIDGIFPKGFTIGRVDDGGEDRSGVQAHHHQAGGRFLVARRGAGRPDADADASGRGEPRVKAAGIILAIALALVLQTTIARYVAGRDRRRGPRAGRGGVRRADVRIGRRAADGNRRRTDSGFAVDRASSASAGWRRRSSASWPGIIGTQFIVAQPLPRFLVFFAATVRTRRSRLAWALCWACGRSARRTRRSPGEALGNAVVGVAAFQLVELLPGAVERRRMGKSRLRR